jgi:DNA-binding transcriptional LysR family regulator
MRQTPDIRQLKCFMAVAAAGSINGAAQALNIAQSAVSRRVHALEAEIGRQLFRRSRQGVTLTDAGEVLRHAAADVLSAHDRLALAMYPQEADRVLQLGATGSASELVLNGLIAGLSRARPDVRVELHEAHPPALLSGVRDGWLDIAIAFWPDLDNDLHFTPLWEEELHLVGPAGRAAEFDALADLPFLLPSYSPLFRRHVEAAFARAGRPLAIAMQVESVRGACAVIAAGQAFSILPWLSVATDARAGLVTTEPLDIWVARGTLCRVAEMHRPLQKLIPALILADLERRLHSDPQNAPTGNGGIRAVDKALASPTGFEPVFPT